MMLLIFPTQASKKMHPMISSRRLCGKSAVKDYYLSLISIPLALLVVFVYFFAAG